MKTLRNVITYWSKMKKKKQKNKQTKKKPQNRAYVFCSAYDNHPQTKQNKITYEGLRNRGANCKAALACTVYIIF